MGRRPSDAPERLTAAAGELLQEHGYHGTGIKDVVLAAGAPMGSLYFHFPGGKGQLAQRALDAGGSRVDGELADAFTFDTDVRSALAAYLGRVAQELEASGFRRGCPIATTALEVGAHDDDLAATADRWFRSWTERIAERLRHDGHAEADRTATLVVAAVEGALVLARVRRSVEPLTAVAASLDAILAGPRRRSGRRDGGRSSGA